MKNIFILSIFILISFNTSGQTTIPAPASNDFKPTKPAPEKIDSIRPYRDMVALGFGIGEDYGGIGINLTIYPQKNIGVFGGVGFVLAGIGYNTGIKLRLIPDASFMRVSPFVTAMYGYNATVKVVDEPDYDKIFYGPSAGGGIDLRFRKNKGYLSFGIIIPFRDAEVQEYMDMLEQEKNVDFGAGLLPVTISVGYRIVIT